MFYLDRSAAIWSLSIVLALVAFGYGEGEGPRSGELFVPESGDTIPPEPATGVTAVSCNGGLSVQWTGSADTWGDLAGYAIRIKEEGGAYQSPIPVGTDTARLLTGLSNGMEYTVQVQALDTVGNASLSMETHGVPVKLMEAIDLCVSGDSLGQDDPYEEAFWGVLLLGSEFNFRPVLAGQTHTMTYDGLGFYTLTTQDGPGTIKINILPTVVMDRGAHEIGVNIRGQDGRTRAALVPVVNTDLTDPLYYEWDAGPPIAPWADFPGEVLVDQTDGGLCSIIDLRGRTTYRIITDALFGGRTVEPARFAGGALTIVATDGSNTAWVLDFTDNTMTEVINGVATVPVTLTNYIVNP
ncbi:MAG: fibronectin type III domain-containing protein [Planctomycetota bacterium]